jgi:hypothetical protein
MSLRIAPRTLLTAVLVFASLLVATGPARAGLVFEVQNVTAAAGSTGDTLNVLLMNTGPSAVTIAGFSFGLTSTSAITFTDVTDATSTNTYIFAGHSEFGPDLDISAGPGSSIQAADNYNPPDAGFSVAANSTVGLGLVFFNLASNASGPITVSFQPYPDSSLSDPSGNNISITTFDSGTITVPSAVPEPSSLVLLATALIGTASIVRARRGRPAR